MDTRDIVGGKWYFPADGHLPPEGEYVLLRITRTTWIARKDPEGVYFKVASLRKGLSLADRAKLPDSNPRKRTICCGDETEYSGGAYIFEPFGPGGYGPTEVDAWMRIIRPDRPRLTR